MNKITIAKKNKEELNLLMHKSSADSVMVFVSGSGGVKEEYLPIAKLLYAKGFTDSLVSFSFRGREAKKDYPYTQQIEDLQDVMDYLIQERFSKITLVPTSMGFLSVASILNMQQYAGKITKVLMLDPADYPLDMSRESWAGNDDFIATDQLFSYYLKGITSGVKISVIHFGLRNYDKNYRKRTNSERGQDNPQYYCRLNKQMSLNIFKAIPEANRGDFIEDLTLPHAFSRDGEVTKNHEVITEYLIQT